MATEVSTLELLSRGEIAVKGRMPDSSNATFLVEVALAGAKTFAIYKPGRGERPLWDFPPELYRREIAAYRFSEALGWGLVPLTIPREGPFGAGSLQHFVDADFEQHYFTLLEREEQHERLKVICLFDLAANNADRKSGHCLLGPDDAIYAIDNGLTFHVEPKLRTVIWDFAGQPIPDARLDDLARVARAGVPDSVGELLEVDEQKALQVRIKRLVAERKFPRDRGGHRYPWPLV